VGSVTEEFLIQKIESLRKADSAARKVAAR
jgi:hypothetical protein